MNLPQTGFLLLLLSGIGRSAAAGNENDALNLVLIDPAATRTAKEAALGGFIPFEPETARALLGFLGREPDPGLRTLAAFRLNGAVSYLEPASPWRDQALAFLLDPQTASAVKHLAVEDSTAPVRSRMIQFMASVMFPFGPAELDGLAGVYVPILLLEVASDPVLDNKNEALWALTQFAGSGSFHSPETVAALRRLLAQESDSGLKERIQEVLAESEQEAPRSARLGAIESGVAALGERAVRLGALESGAVPFWDASGAAAAALPGPSRGEGHFMASTGANPARTSPPGALASALDPEPGLSEKAAIFQKRAEGALNAFGLVGTGSDAPIWTGIYAASQARRFQATGDPRALEAMENSLRGLHALHEVTGIPGLMARNIEPLSGSGDALPKDWHAAGGAYAGYRWKGHESWDQYLGYVHGVVEAWPFIRDPELRERVRGDLRNTARHFMENDGKIVALDTYLDSAPNYYYQDRWPKPLRWAFGWITNLLPSRGGNPMHGLHLMQAASLVTQDPEITRYYREKMLKEDGYAWYVQNRTQGHTESATSRWSWLITGLSKLVYGWKHGFDIKATPDSLRADVGQNLGHVALYDLARLEEDPAVRRRYLDALKAAHQGVARHSNTYWNFLYAGLHADDPGAVPEGLDSLRKFPMGDYGSRKNSDDPGLEKYKGLSGNFFKSARPWKWVSVRPVPFERRPMHSFAWQQNALELDGGYGSADAPGVAYLAAYWLGRSSGFVPTEGQVPESFRGRRPAE